MPGLIKFVQIKDGVLVLKTIKNLVKQIESYFLKTQEIVDNIDFSYSTTFTFTATKDTTITISSSVLKGSLVITNGGNYNIVFKDVKFPNGIAPTLTKNGTDIITFLSDGTSWFAKVDNDFK